MFLCEDNRTKAGLRVALGTGGLDKRVQGDAKVPLGEYALTWPVSSKDYHLFIPVGYPTDEQRKGGYTGSAIGVHGPLRWFKGPSSTDRDWTLGCIAVGTDEEIERVAQWVKTKRVRRIVIAAQ
jgi:murein L,D-transpeptidase YafK